MKSIREAGGFQIAFFTLAANFVSIPIGKLIGEAIHSSPSIPLISQSLILLIGAIAIVGFPALRFRSKELLSRPILPQRRGELLVVVLIDVTVVALGIAGGIAAWSFLKSGPDGLRHTLSPEIHLAGALSVPGLVRLLMAVIMAPIVEEIVFRGFMYEAWQRRFGPVVSALLTSVVFAVYHPFFLVAFVQSIVFICVLRRTCSLRGPILLHSCSNLALWYPLFGRFVFPSNPTGDPMVWLPHFISLAACVALLPWYIWLASSRHEPRISAVEPENQIHD